MVERYRDVHDDETVGHERTGRLPPSITTLTMSHTPPSSLLETGPSEAGVTLAADSHPWLADEV